MVDKLANMITSPLPIFRVFETSKIKGTDEIYNLEKKEKLSPRLNEILMNKDEIENLIAEKKKKAKAYKIAGIANFSFYTKIELFLRSHDSTKPKLNVKDETCSICMCEVFENIEKTSFKEMIDELNTVREDDVLKLDRCEGHYFHLACIENYIQAQTIKDWIKCPICCFIYGQMKGDMPPGTMTYTVDKNTKCSGYEKYGTIIINYSFPSGKLPNGKKYHGTHRTAYLPDSDEGRECYALLKKAFDRKLTFTVGTSVTTGMADCVVWNGIHHKTNVYGGSSSFGYPDATYFNRLKQELAAKGVL
jgi:deltex-like protein